MNALLILVLSIFLVSLSGDSIRAQTADSQTPAQETLCDLFVGAAYGLCTAYCEAMDCDSADPKASVEACNKVSQRFQQMTGTLPPCTVPPPGPISPPPGL